MRKEAITALFLLHPLNKPQERISKKPAGGFENTATMRQRQAASFLAKLRPGVCSTAQVNFIAQGNTERSQGLHSDEIINIPELVTKDLRRQSRLG
jgi:hypothetical protein